MTTVPVTRTVLASLRCICRPGEFASADRDTFAAPVSRSQQIFAHIAVEAVEKLRRSGRLQPNGDWYVWCIARGSHEHRRLAFHDRHSLSASRRGRLSSLGRAAQFKLVWWAFCLYACSASQKCLHS